MTYTAYGLQGNDNMTEYSLEEKDEQLNFLCEDCQGNLFVKTAYQNKKKQQKKGKRK